MPEISRFFGIIVRMFKNEHPPPHIHAVYGEYSAVFAIEDGRHMEGSMPARQAGLVQNWISLHRAELQQNWVLLENEKLPRKVAPLD